MNRVFKNLNELLNPIMPEVKLPKKEKDCPAAPICESVGNLRQGCCAGSSFLTDHDPAICTASLILLVSRAFGMWPQEMIEETEKKRKIGFGPEKQQEEK